jgi:hypothetical protein
MTIENARERFKQAIGILADEKGCIKERLMIAYSSHLLQIDPEQELPEPLATDFIAIKYRLTTDQVVGDRGTVSKEIEKIDDEEASQIARQLFEMFLEVYDLKETNHESGTNRS